MITEQCLAYATFERCILDLYEQSRLTLDVLDQVAEQYHRISLDGAGGQSLLTHDGKDLYQIAIELIDPTFPTVVRNSPKDDDEYWERELKKWEEIVHQRWGWRTYYSSLSPVRG